MTKTTSPEPFSAIQWQDDQLHLLDQRLLPDQEKWLSYSDAKEVAQAITEMVVRGAPAIGIVAAYAVALSLKNTSESNWKEKLSDDIKLLSKSRPTAVNLFWALDRMSKTLSEITTVEMAYDIALQTAKDIHSEDYAMNCKMGEYGADFLSDNTSVLTHCNTGALATGGHGTALGVIRTAWELGKLKHVYANETRPWMQGSRLTAWELLREKIPATVQVESAAALLMQDKKVDWFICGADRIAANGDTANKIGTYTMALLAKQFDVKVMVVAPTTTIDLNLSDGSAIPIEKRSATELWRTASQKLPPSDLDFFNPAFDLTPAEFIDAIVSEQGVAVKGDDGSFTQSIGQWFS